MAIGRLMVGKGGSMRTPVIQIKGDGNTQVIELIVQRYYGGIDLAPLRWSVTAENAAGATDEYEVSNVQVMDDMITMRWMLYGTVTAAAGLAKFKLTGFKADEQVLVWQSGTYYIQVNNTIEYKPGSEVGQELSNVHKLIVYVDQELNNVVQAGKDAAEAAETANKAAGRVDARVEALEKFTFKPESYTITDDMVQLDNYEGMPMNVVTAIEPVQSGSGDPSPDNIRPITGHTGDVLTVNAETFTADFGQTVYGGTYDWNTGVLTVDRGYRAFDGSENWTGAGSAFTNCLAFNVTVSDCVFNNNRWTEKASSHMKTMTANEYSADNNINGIGGYGKVVTIKLLKTLLGNATGTNAEHVDDFKAYLAAQYAAGTPVQLCYKLDTPIIIQLTPQDIYALSGVNTLYAEAGDVTVSGRKDILWLTSHLINKLKALSNT